MNRQRFIAVISLSDMRFIGIGTRSDFDPSLPWAGQ